MSDVSALIDAKVIIGHPKGLSNPKTRQSWLGTFSGTVVFDPQKVNDQIEAAQKKVQKAKKNNKEILVICEKSLYKEEIEALAEKSGFHFLNHKVPSGVMTNFETLLGRIKSLKALRVFVESESFASLTKKEQSMKKRELKKIEQVYKGVVNLKKKPDLVVIVDGQLMHKFVLEVEKLKSDAIVLASSDFDKLLDGACIVHCNVNSRTSVDYVMSQMFS